MSCSLVFLAGVRTTVDLGSTPCSIKPEKQMVVILLFNAFVEIHYINGSLLSIICCFLEFVVLHFHLTKSCQSFYGRNLENQLTAGMAVMGSIAQ